MKLGDLVTICAMDREKELNGEYVHPYATGIPVPWFAEAMNKKIPLIFLEWCPPPHAYTDSPYREHEPEEYSRWPMTGYAELLHPDGSRKVVHEEYFRRAYESR